MGKGRLLFERSEFSRPPPIRTAAVFKSRAVQHRLYGLPE